jgi:hypothetical protein
MPLEAYWLFPLSALNQLAFLAAMVFLAIGAHKHHDRTRAWYAACLGIAALCGAAGACLSAFGTGAFGLLSRWGLGGIPVAHLVPLLSSLESWAKLLSAALGLVGGAGLILRVRRAGWRRPVACRADGSSMDAGRG